MSCQARIEVVPLALLEALAAEAPDPKPPPPPAPAAGGKGGAYTSRLLVGRWLADRGVAHRVKPQPDGKGRTVYVLKECPFDASHGDPDACVMQDANGKLSAHCFHNGCTARGWQAFKEALGAPGPEHYDPPLASKSSGKRKRRPAKQRAAPAPPGGTGDPPPGGAPPEGLPPDAVPPEGEAGLPRIQGNRRQLRHVTDDALCALLACNDPPAIFQRGGLLTRLRVREETGAPFLEPLTDPALRGVLARTADWTKVNQTQDGLVEEEEAPPLEVVKDLANLPGWEGVPGIDAVVECPPSSPAPGSLSRSRGFTPRRDSGTTPPPASTSRRSRPTRPPPTSNTPAACCWRTC